MFRMAAVELDHGWTVACLCPHDMVVGLGEACVLEHDRVLEYGNVTELAERHGDPSSDQGRAHLVRRATLQDQAKAHDNALAGRTARETCLQKAAKHKLALHLVRVRYSFDRSLLTVVFTSEERLDFWGMVKELGSELRVRVEMKQIGVRDEAGLIGGIGPCGRNQCCCSWLRRFDSINVRMAKTQRLSLNPGAISGNCGRLKCCLKYEFDQYRELGKTLPREGTCVECPGGCGEVVDSHVLTQRVKVRLDDDRVAEYAVAEVREKGPSRRKPRRQQNEKAHPDSEWTESEPARKA